MSKNFSANRSRAFSAAAGCPAAGARRGAASASSWLVVVSSDSVLRSSWSSSLVMTSTCLMLLFWMMLGVLLGDDVACLHEDFARGLVDDVLDHVAAVDLVQEPAGPALDLASSCGRGG